MLETVVFPDRDLWEGPLSSLVLWVTQGAARTFPVRTRCATRCDAVRPSASILTHHSQSVCSTLSAQRRVSSPCTVINSSPSIAHSPVSSPTLPGFPPYSLRLVLLSPCSLKASNATLLGLRSPNFPTPQMLTQNFHILFSSRLAQRSLQLFLFLATKLIFGASQ